MRHSHAVHDGVRRIQTAAMKTTLRLFVAVPVPDPVARFLKDIRGRLETPEMNIRWAPVKNIHLTLQFLGDVETAAVASITDQMDAAAGAVAPFSIAAKGVGGFPTLRRFRILWVGLDDEKQHLTAIQSALASRLETIGFTRERRRFHPHLTIGRARQPIDGRRLGQRLPTLADCSSEPLPVDRICLFASQLKPGGADYTCLHTSHLAG